MTIKEMIETMQYYAKAHGENTTVVLQGKANEPDAIIYDAFFVVDEEHGGEMLIRMRSWLY